ncbi:hypothetical protein AB0T83_13925 [Fluviibacterium sp. DFM31]|uniref:Uncharacterized protein n=1 Tax=Meridianimarinicoccus marinus TaxID=3231483 RepID=A0ABV3L8P2_9RHOB
MRKISSVTSLENFGRTRLSRFFFMRDFLFSEIAAIHLRPNLPEDPDLAITAGTRLCTDLLDPLVETFGPMHVRSALRGADLNAFGNAKGLNCARNAASAANHIWDRRDAQGRMGACACIVIPWFADRYAQGRDWRHLAWWLHDHLPYSALQFFPRLAAFNLTWREDPEGRIASYIAPRGLLLRPGAPPPMDRAARQRLYADFPEFRGIRYPD